MYYVYALHPQSEPQLPREPRAVIEQGGPFPTMAAALAYVDKMRPRYDCEVWLDLLEVAMFRRMPVQA